MTTSPEYLFVYGTLMKGFSNPFSEKLSTFSSFVGNGSFPGLLYLVSWYPGAVYSQESDFAVFGEVYHIPNSSGLMNELDEYEDVFEDESVSLYVKRIIPVKMWDNTSLDCWVYLYNQPVTDLKQIESGCFRRM
jgi:gamma-glutamylcyclotransferase (GGCT)/AIG2-like uncharacterized protein YtfP